MGGIRASSTAWLLLNAIADGIEIFEYSVFRPTALLRYGLQDLKALEVLQKRQNIYTTLKRLERRKLILIRKEENRKCLALTEFGLNCLKEVAEYSKRRLPEGTYTIVSFDIPERSRSERQVFRRFLKKIGFKRYHLSVWISEFDYFDLLSSHAKRLKINSWVTVIQGRLMENPL